MSSEGATTEVEEAEQGKYSPVVYFNYFRNNPRAVVSPLLYLVAAWAYYTLSKNFLYNSLLNLTAGRIERLSDSPFILFEATETIEVIEATSLNFTAALCIILFYGIYSLGKGNLTQRQYDIRLQAVAILGAFPFISFSILHILYLLENDESWYFDLFFMEEMAGFTLSNQWPFETVLQNPRWEFYRVGLFNAIRVVLLSIVCCTILGIVVGVSRLSANRMLAGLAESYVEFFRNMPLVVQLFFLYTVVLGANLPPFKEIQDNSFFDWIFISNRGVDVPETEIVDMTLFLLGIGALLAARIYIRFSERVLIDNDNDVIEPIQPHPPSFSLVYARYMVGIIRQNLSFLARPFAPLGKRIEPVLIDIIFSVSILVVLYGVFNVVEWNYTVKADASEGGLGFRFLLSFIQGISTYEPLSMFILGLIILILSTLITFNVDAAGLNTFTVDDSSKGLRYRSILWGGVILVMCIFFYLSIGVEQPNLITEKNGEELAWGLWKFEEGTSQRISSMFLTLWIGLTLYTTAQVAEIVRGSIQSLPRGQVEAAISLGLTPYQRLRLVILPQALRSMIPSMTNQYLNCWKNSSLAFVVAFSDFYAVFTTIVNNAGQEVPVFIMILLTYQAGSLTISAFMNYLNSRVTKVKI
jgi:His/Glu/Gln/Arg/opine family amino acid ABC transporter permease subunit|tara:strand:+ start:100 stop:2019 length:1920 start_codon:yes stop_codon:yes gene_type:complete